MIRTPRDYLPSGLTVLNPHRLACAGAETSCRGAGESCKSAPGSGEVGDPPVFIPPPLGQAKLPNFIARPEG